MADLKDRFTRFLRRRNRISEWVCLLRRGVSMQRLVIVPARGGSKRLPGKNVRLLAGKALINHTVEIAQACFDCVIVTSDAPDILAAVKTAPNVTTELRPSQLATDGS